MRILIVEDEVAVARQIASALTEAGHDPKAVHDGEVADRKSTRLNSSHSQISYAVFCLKKKNINSFTALRVTPSLIESFGRSSTRSSSLTGSYVLTTFWTSTTHLLAPKAFTPIAAPGCW